MHGPESLPYRPSRALPKKPAREDIEGDSESRIWQPTSSREAAGLSPPPRSTGGAPGKRGGGYGWSICPTFYECLSTKQHQDVRRPQDFARDAAKGKLANVSFLIPFYDQSQHNGYSLIKGDNWIAKNVEAVMQGPDWSSTAIFITYDDCGCFYDPVPPPAGQGVRVPMVIVSPYAKPGFVDHTDASFASILAFVEHLWGIPPLGPSDADAYDYAGAFNFAQAPLPAVALPQHRVPASSLASIARHPPPDDDPT